MLPPELNSRLGFINPGLIFVHFFIHNFGWRHHATAAFQGSHGARDGGSQHPVARVEVVHERGGLGGLETPKPEVFGAD